MPRLSCIIPVVGNSQELETTLVSVLERRPTDCEILVVLNKPYADPYGLKGEVRFVEAPGAGMAACATLGIQVSRGPIAHVLAAGFEVSEGWADAALPHFADPEVAAVVPVIRAMADPGRILAAGVKYQSGGRRIVCTTLPKSGSTGAEAMGPSIDAGFYRKNALEALGDGLPVNLGDRLADVDLALGLQYAGLRTVLEPECVVLAEQLAADEISGFQAGLHAERLFLRNLPVTGWRSAFAFHPLIVAAELLRSIPRGTTLTQMAGRLAAWFSLSEYRMHHHLLDVARETIDRELAEQAVIAKLPEPMPAVSRRKAG